MTKLRVAKTPRRGYFIRWHPTHCMNMREIERGLGGRGGGKGESGAGLGWGF